MKKLAWLVTVALPLTQPSMAADDLITRQMADEARMWQQKDREDLAANIWRRLLITEPRHRQALVQLGIIEARSGNLAAAESLYARARRSSPPAPELAALAEAIDLRKNGAHRKPAPYAPTDVAAAAPAVDTNPAPASPRSASKTSTEPAIGQREALRLPSAPAPAVPKAERREKPATPGRLTPGNASDKGTVRTPVDDIQRVNDEDLLVQRSRPEASETDWVETRQKLEQLVRRGGNPTHAFVLARHLTYRDATRREGIRQLASLPEDLQRNDHTRSAWRAALLALTPRPGDAALYSDYMKRYPSDTAVDDKGRGLPMSPHDGTSRGVSPPRSSLPRAKASTPQPDASRRQEVEVLVRAAGVDERAGVHGAAAKKLEQAMLLDPADPSVRIRLARQYQAMGALDAAASLLDEVLVADPAQGEALHVRAQLFALQERWHEGLYLLERLPPASRSSELVRIQRVLWAGAQAARARQSLALGDQAQALRLLEQTEARADRDGAMLALIAPVWAECGQPDRGLRLIRDALSRMKSAPVALHIAYAEMLLLTGQDAELTTVLRGLAAHGQLAGPDQQRVNGVILAYTVRLAESLREAGRLSEASAMLAPVIQRLEEPRVQLAMARVYQASGEPARALSLVEKTLAGGQGDIGLRLLAAELAIGAKDIDKAAMHVNAALGAAPQHPRTLSAAGRIERAKGDNTKAVEYFSQSYAMEYNPPPLPGRPLTPLLRLVAHESAAGALLSMPPATGLLPIPDASLRTTPPGGTSVNMKQRAPIHVAPPAPLLPLSRTREKTQQSVASWSGNSGRVAYTVARFDGRHAAATATLASASKWAHGEPRRNSPDYVLVSDRAAGLNNGEGVRLRMSTSLALPTLRNTNGKT